MAVAGDFAGIQDFVFRPVPGAGGAARRLRSRSFHVSAYAELVMRWCKEQLAQGGPKTLYAAGGKFLIGVSPFPGLDSKLQQMQQDLDRWTWKNFGGELIFHLASVPFDSGKIPLEGLRNVSSAARNRPLERVLCSAGGWSEREFFQPALPGAGRCDACGMTRQIKRNDQEEWVCRECEQDEEIGRRLPEKRFAHISTDAAADVSALGLGLKLYENRNGRADGQWLALEGDAAGAGRWPVFRHAPKNAAGKPLDFDEIARLAPGPRKWLGYLRIDGDCAGKHFSDLHGDPRRTWALSCLLNLFFADSANCLVTGKFPNIYPVYGGGDDLFVVGPWTETLAFALELRQQLRTAVGDSLTFSAGLSLAKPKEHMLTQAELAREELKSAKGTAGYGRNCGRDQIRALGVTADWGVFETLLKDAQQVTRWVNDKEVPSSFLHRLLQLHNDWKRRQRRANGKASAALVRYKPLLYYQVQRNLKKGEAQDWALNLLKPGLLWRWADFIARYAMLAAECKSD